MTHATPMTPNVPPAVQILTIVLYAGFAISVSIVAMAIFGLVGLVLAALFAWQWARIPALGGASAPPQSAAPSEPTAPRPSGNAAFDAYRDTTLARLEAEQRGFEDFLERLRKARDAEEFDRFMAEKDGRSA
jgi:hypothetical protein